MRTVLVLIIALVAVAVGVHVLVRGTSDPQPRRQVTLALGTPPGGAQLQTPLALTLRDGATRVLIDADRTLVEHALAADAAWTVLPTSERIDLRFGQSTAEGGMILFGSITPSAVGALASPAISRDGGSTWDRLAEPTWHDGAGWPQQVRVADARLALLGERQRDARRTWLATSADSGATWTDAPAGWRADEPGYREAIHALAISPVDHQPLCAIAWSEEIPGSANRRWTLRLARGGGDPRQGQEVPTWSPREPIMTVSVQALDGGAWLLIQSPSRIAAVWMDHAGTAGPPQTVATHCESGFASAVSGGRCLIAWLDTRESVKTRFGPWGARFRSIHVRPYWRELRGPADPPHDVSCADGPAQACSIPVIAPADGGFRLAWWVQPVGVEDPLRPAPGTDARLRVAVVP